MGDVDDVWGRLTRLLDASVRRIESVFTGPRLVTIIVRDPASLETSIVYTNDSTDGIREVLDYADAEQMAEVDRG